MNTSSSGSARVDDSKGHLFYVGLAFFLTGSGLNVTCINMMLTERFTSETLIKDICGAVALTLIYLTLRHPDRREKRNMTA